jgi:hypothetical protein
MLSQGTLTEGDVSVQLTSSIRYVVLLKKEKYSFSLKKAADLN